MKKLLYPLLLSGLFACSKGQDVPSGKLVTSNDFETMVGWIPDASTLTKSVAHSGKYSIKVDPDHGFSLGYTNTLGDISAQRVQKLRIDAWVYLPNSDSKAVLVTQVKPAPGEDRKEVWEGLGLAEEIKKYNTWVKVRKDITLPETVTANDILQVYLWRADAAATVFLDDLQISIPD